jgi:phosphoglycerol geranylgeranyltransferase
MDLLSTIEDKAKRNKKSVVLLIDPDKYEIPQLQSTISIASDCGVSFLLVGGSIINKSINDKIVYIKSISSFPVFLFPGNLLQLCNQADGILLLSLISGRNPEFLIGNHVHAAPFLRNSGMEIIPTGYILIDTGKKTSVEYISNTIPIPSDKVDIAIATALAGEMLGMKLIYLEGGSGASEIVNADIIREVKKNVQVPLIVGGGINTKEQAKEIFEAGADIIVVGNAIEKKPQFLHELSEFI